MARNRALDALAGASDPSSSFDSNSGDMRPHVLRKMMGNETTPGGAISETPSGTYKVNDLNPSNGIQNFGSSPTKAGALKHLRAIEFFKHGGK